MQPLLQSLLDQQRTLRRLEERVIDSDLEFDFDHTQLAYQIEGLLTTLEETIDDTIRVYGE